MYNFHLFYCLSLTGNMEIFLPWAFPCQVLNCNIPHPLTSHTIICPTLLPWFCFPFPPYGSLRRHGENPGGANCTMCKGGRKPMWLRSQAIAKPQSGKNPYLFIKAFVWSSWAFMTFIIILSVVSSHLQIGIFLELVSSLLTVNITSTFLWLIRVGNSSSCHPWIASQDSWHPCSHNNMDVGCQFLVLSLFRGTSLPAMISVGMKASICLWSRNWKQQHTGVIFLIVALWQSAKHGKATGKKHTKDISI